VGFEHSLKCVRSRTDELAMATVMCGDGKSPPRAST
jgi:hypothetical protein